MKGDEPHDERQFHVEDGRGRWRTAGDSREQQRTTEDAGDDTMPSVLVLAQDGCTAPLRTLS